MEDKGAVLSKYEILEEKEKGNIVISPFREENLAPCSYDVTIGEHYYIQNKEKTFYNPWSKEQTEEFFILKRAKTLNKEQAYMWGFQEGDRIIPVYPNETILCHTNEYIGGKINITTKMQARSSIGRAGLSVCRCAGWGDVGYVNRWTMEITNPNKVIIPLLVNSRVAQIVFMRTGNLPEEDSYKGKYQGEDWTPENMLPKLYLDYSM